MTTTPTRPNQPSRLRPVTAVLGPTNTGKTHLAVERMLGYETGMIGLPLRLLAREVFDRVVTRAGAGAVALITGEEKIIPPEPRYYVCTVEAMPHDIECDFVAIDEVQLAAGPERGHVFTDRMLHRRGLWETMLLGADTVRPLIEQLLPGANFVSRPRFSRLRFAGQKKISRLPRRSAIVAFSADTVYGIAELIRRQRGGAAVVLGALSPRTRNAQVALYESGDVDFLVATDAIGMGLNMDVDHVAFAALSKFDGERHRDLTPAELAQIAGRAGRHMSDGTFGVTADAPLPEAEVIERIEDHNFVPLSRLQWRNRTLDFSSLESLRRSLERLPQTAGLMRARAACDLRALSGLMRDEEIVALASREAAVERLWEVCQIPDYRAIAAADHGALVARIYRFLMSPAGTIPADWLTRQLSYADRLDGDIDTIANRIAHVRTWTFIANRSDWLGDAQRWREHTRAIEDRLSDALHERLTQRFVDRRTAVLMRRLREKEHLMTSVEKDGDVLVEGEFVGRLNGFQFVPDQAAEGVHGKALRSASLKAVAEEIAGRADRFAAGADLAIELSRDARVSWHGDQIARLKATSDWLRPGIALIAGDQLEGRHRQAVQDRLQRWIDDRVERELAPLTGLAKASEIDAAGRGLAFRLIENHGVLRREDVSEVVAGLDQNVRGQLRKFGVRFGAFHIFVPALLKPAAVNLLLVLWGLQRERAGDLALDTLPEPPGQGLTSLAVDPSWPDGFLQVAGFKVCSARAVRIDMLERLADLIRPLVYWKPKEDGKARPDGSVVGGGFTVIPDMMSLVGCSGEEFAEILRNLGFKLDRRRVRPEAGPGDGDGDSAAGSEPVISRQVAPTQVDGKPAQGPVDAKPHGGGPDRSGRAPDQPEALEFVDVWRPKGRKRTRPMRSKSGDGERQQHRPAKDGRKKPAKVKRADPARDTSQRRDKPERIDENSPFAVLGALKETLKRDAR